jgi:hypothetical protein
MKFIIILISIVFPFSVFANSFDLKIDCDGIGGVRNVNSGIVGKVKRDIYKFRPKNISITIKNKMCEVENNGETVKYELLDFSDEWILCSETISSTSERSGKLYRSWTLQINRYTGKGTRNFNMKNELGEINPLDDRKPIQLDQTEHAKYNCKKAKKAVKLF